MYPTTPIYTRLLHLPNASDYPPNSMIYLFDLLHDPRAQLESIYDRTNDTNQVNVNAHCMITRKRPFRQMHLFRYIVASRIFVELLASFFDTYNVRLIALIG